MVAMAVDFNFDSLRARKARSGKLFSKLIINSLHGLGLVCVILGLALLIVSESFGWVLIGFGMIPVVIAYWAKQGLRDIKPDTGESLDAVVDSELLAYLPEKLTPKSLVQAAMKTSSGQFFAARFGLAPNFLADLSSDSQLDTPNVLLTATDIQHIAQKKVLDGSVITASIASTQDMVTQLLPRLQIDESDLIRGVKWHERLNTLIEETHTPKRTGGIARDWSFGYANTLNRFGVNFSDQVARGGMMHVRLDSHANALRFLHETFGSSGRQNVALIGPLGAGKTTVVRAFAESLLAANSSVPAHLKFRQIVSLDAGAIIGAAGSRSQLERLLNQLLLEAYHAKNIILCLDEAQCFFEDRPGSVDLSSILLPVIEGGGIRMILTMDDQRYLQISQRNASLASALNRINVPSANMDESMLVMQDQLILTEFNRNVTYMYQALKEAYRLSERYIHELAQPGKSVRLLEQAATYAENGVVTASSVARTIEESVGVKVSRVDTDDERQKLLQLEDHIHERMINQTRAVSVVSNALRRARAGVRNETRPIGTFLFLGPTGVGKTELSKALAEAYFGGEDRLVRVDLNEFVRPDDVVRLIADGATDGNSLAAQIMRQPFSVVLLDEIEKAHPQVMTTLLQMLDEGVLRDINNREVSFRDSIVIATSNAGSDTIRKLIDKGYQLEDVEKEFVNRLIDTQQFRPEFLNRFDEIVLFRPLTQSELGQVVQLIIKGINKTLEPQKISLSLDQEAVDKLASVGYDPRMGARPMRRIVQRTVENLIARRLLDGSAQPGDVIVITVDDIQVS